MERGHVLHFGDKYSSPRKGRPRGTARFGPARRSRSGPGLSSWRDAPQARRSGPRSGPPSFGVFGAVDIAETGAEIGLGDAAGDTVEVAATTVVFRLPIRASSSGQSSCGVGHHRTSDRRMPELFAARSVKSKPLSPESES